MEAFFRPVSFPFLAFLFLPNFFFFFCTGLSELRCIDTERQALLNFKQHLIDPSNRLSSWTAHGDCCQWEGVVCHNDHNVTGHVHELHLRTSYPEGGFATTEQDEAYAAVNVWCKETGGLEVDWFYVSMALGFVVGFWSITWIQASGCWFIVSKCCMILHI
ncbi:hypothetical protein CMV_015506 [Castanea mollissima]|uniref:Leucine-rich repeat-containing N-terminal plant-type domain-containing protein n=1 Tax=Castanea mollissima TaxID=60419 RepID=A0A8J4VK09_9ROSI|nr:hypothetical protein CMV_015506 [Castanea mollissima]